jgi:hypothetical protein
MSDNVKISKIMQLCANYQYTKELPTFTDALALVRCCLWSDCHFSTSSQSRDVVKVPRSLLERLSNAVCYAA